jgi:hypothetical protein
LNVYTFAIGNLCVRSFQTHTHTHMHACIDSSIHDPGVLLALEKLILCLSDLDVDVRRAAANAVIKLARTGDSQVVYLCSRRNMSMRA